MFATWAQWLIRHRQRAVALGVILVSIPLAGLPKLGVDFSIQTLFGSEDPAVAGFRASRDQWGPDDATLAVVVRSPDSITQRHVARALHDATVALRDVEGIGQVFGWTETVTAVPGPLGRPVPVPLHSTRPASDDDAWTQRLLLRKDIVPNWISADGKYAWIAATMDFEPDDAAAIQPVIRNVEAALAPLDTAGVSWRIAGVPAIRAGMLDEIVRTSATTVPLTLIAMTAVLWWVFRSVHGVLLPATAAVLPAVLLLGTMGWTGEPLGILNQIYVTLIPAIAVADAIHLLERFHEEWRRRGSSAATKADAVIAAVRDTGPAIAATSLTTVVGFLSLGLADMPVLRSFGAYAALGMGFAFVIVMTWVPLALLQLSGPVPVRQMTRLDDALAAVAASVVRRPNRAIAVAAVCFAAALAATATVPIDNHLAAELPPAHPSSEGTQWLDEHLGGSLTVTLDVGHADGPRLDTLEALALLERLEHTLAGAPEVRAVWGPASALKASSQLHGGPDALPTRPATARRLLSALPTHGPSAVLDETRRRARIQATIADRGAQSTLGVIRSVEPEIRSALHASGVPGELTGTPLIGYRGALGISGDLVRSLSMALLVITCLVACLFRSWRLGISTLPANLLPLAIGGAFLRAVGWPMDIVPAVVLTIGLGIAVDDTIHLTNRHLEGIRAGFEPQDAAQRAVRTSGRAVVITSVLLSGGLAINGLSSFPSTARFGLLGATLILAALAADLLVLPALLVRNQPR